MSFHNSKLHDDPLVAKKQFESLKQLAISQEKTISHYSKKDYELSEEKLNILEDSLESEKKMNDTLTKEIQSKDDEIINLKQLVKSQEKLISHFEKKEQSKDLVKELKENQKKLLSLIYNSAIGEMTMNYNCDIEYIAKKAFEITGISAENFNLKDK